MLNYLNIKKENQLKFLLIWTMLCMTCMGGSLGIAITITLFLKRLGVEFLPYCFILSDLSSALGTLFLVKFTKGIRRDKPLIAYVFVVGTLLFISRFLISTTATEDSSLTPSFLLFLTVALISIGSQSFLLSQIWGIAIDVFTPKEGKNLFPLIGTALVTGNVIAGTSIVSLVFYVGIINLVFLWSLSFFVIFGCIFLFKKKYGGLLESMHLRILQSSKNKQKNTQSSPLKLLFLSPLALILLALVSFDSTLTIIKNFQYNRALNATFQTEESLSAFFGYFNILTNFTTILLQVFIVKKAVKAIGVSNVLYILPTTIVLGFFSITIHFTFWPVVLLHFFWKILYNSVHSYSYQLYYNGIVSTYRNKIKTLIDGAFLQISGVLGGVLCLLIPWFSQQNLNAISNFDPISIVGFSFSLILFFYILKNKKKYLQTIINNLTHPDRKTFLDSISSLEEKNSPKALEKLHWVIQNKDEEAQITVLDILPEINSEKSLRVISPFLENPNSKVRAATITAIRQFPILKKDPFLLDFFNYQIKHIFHNDANLDVKTAAACYLIEKQKKENIPHFLSHLLNDLPPETRIKVVSSLLNLSIKNIDFLFDKLLLKGYNELEFIFAKEFWKYEERKEQSKKIILKLFEGNNDSQVKAIRVVIHIKSKEFLPQIKPLITNKGALVSAYASIAYLTIGEESSDLWKLSIKNLLEHLSSDTESVIQKKIMHYCNQIQESALDELILEASQVTGEKKVRLAIHLKQLYQIFSEKEPLSSFNQEIQLMH